MSLLRRRRRTIGEVYIRWGSKGRFAMICHRCSFTWSSGQKGTFTPPRRAVVRQARDHDANCPTRGGGR